MNHPAPKAQAALTALGLAEAALVGQGLGPRQRLRCLRAAFYGGQHSLDFAKRGSRWRNRGFNLYLGHRPSDAEARRLDPALAARLKAHHEFEHQGRVLDLGHIIIGLEARLHPFARAFPWPGHGGTGLDLCTWLGDIAGAAGWLAIARLDAPGLAAHDLLFSAGGYDLTANLEGDIAAWLLPLPGAAGAGPWGAAQALGSYLFDDHGWAQRGPRFTGSLAQRCGMPPAAGSQRLAQALAHRAEAFGRWYILCRLHDQRQLHPGRALRAAAGLRRAADELAAIFVGYLGEACRVPIRRAPIPSVSRSIPRAPCR